MKPTDLIAWRQSLDMEQPAFAAFLGDLNARTVRRWENAEWPIPRTVENLYVLWQLMSAPKRAVATEIMKQGNPK